MRQKLYFYSCYEASKYPREGYTWNYTLKKVKDDLLKNYIRPTRIKIRLIGDETKEYCDQIRVLEKENNHVDLPPN